MTAERLNELARRLDDAWVGLRTIAPLSESAGLTSPAMAYEIQTRWSELRTARGERVLGHKIGLTSQAMRDQIAVAEPDYGRLWESRFFAARRGHVSFPTAVLLQPRVEGEFAFLLGKPLEGTAITEEEVTAATDAVAVAVEVIDSRITDWKIKLVDTIADNASYGAFTLGPWDSALVGADLGAARMRIRQNGVLAVEALGSAVFGHPARAVAWLAGKLNEFGVRLSPGDIVLSGSLGRSLPAASGDEFVIETDGQSPLTVFFD